MKKALACLGCLVVFALNLGVFTMAAETTKTINNATELATAIKDQADGETWVLKAGEYDLTKALMDTYKDIDFHRWGKTEEPKVKGFYFPVTASDLTIRGEGEVVITSSHPTKPEGEGDDYWAQQMFLMIGGDNVTIENVTLRSKLEANKCVEVLGDDFTLKDAKIEPNKDASDDPEDMENFAGTLYFFNPGKSAALENVTLTGGRISLTDADADTTLTMKNVTIDYTGTFIAGYAEGGSLMLPFTNPKGIAVDGTGLTVQLSDEISDAKTPAAVEALPAGTTLKLADGEYVGQWNLKNKLTVVGQSKDKTIIKNNPAVDLALDPGGLTYAGDILTNPLIHSAADLAVSNLTFKGPKKGPVDVYSFCLDGVFGKGNLTVENVLFDEINRPNPLYDDKIVADQTGRCIMAEGAGKVTVKNVTFNRFQKNAIDVNTTGAVLIDGAVIKGLGKQDGIAQNGIVARKGTIEIKNTSISGLQFEKAGNADSGKSAGLYAMGGAKVDSDNTLIETTDKKYMVADTAEITAVVGNATYKYTAGPDGTVKEELVHMSPTKVDIDRSEAELTVGETLRLNLDIDPDEVSGTPVWTSSNAAVATVDSNGNVKAIAEGEARITVTVDGVSDFCVVTVKPLGGGNEVPGPRVSPPTGVAGLTPWAVGIALLGLAVLSLAGWKKLRKI